MNPIDVVITMAGLGSRFREVGYDVPKYMIEVNGRTLFEWSMDSLRDVLKVSDKCIFVALRDEKADVRVFIESKCKSMGIVDYEIVLLDRVTDGQATTAILVSELWHNDHPLLVYNIDTYVEPGEILPEDFRGDGFIPCFKALGDHWSFVRLDEFGRAVEIKEKKRISDNCTIGAYYFKSCGLFKQLYDTYYQIDGDSKIEKYIAPLYDHLLKEGGDIYISIIDSSKVHVLGTPAELEEFRNENDGKNVNDRKARK